MDQTNNKCRIQNIKSRRDNLAPCLGIWEIGLITAAPSQLFKLVTNRRLAVLPKFRYALFKPLERIIKSDPNFRANIIVVAQKTK